MLSTSVCLTVKYSSQSFPSCYLSLLDYIHRDNILYIEYIKTKKMSPEDYQASLVTRAEEAAADQAADQISLSSDARPKKRTRTTTTQSSSTQQKQQQDEVLVKGDDG